MRAFATAAAVLMLPVYAKEAVVRKPLITADPFYGTFELVYDIYEQAYGAVEPMYPHVDKALDLLCEKTGLKKQEVLSKVEDAKTTHAQVKATVMEQAAKAHDAVAVKTSDLVEKLNEKMPKYAGIVPSKPADLLVFVIYCALVLYITFRIVAFSFKLGFGLFCFFCCCGCCRGKGNKAPTQPLGKKAKAKAKANTNGKK
eukprot:TRINITY_DN11425_c0_g1_i1.p1 TRINITY_DN11425_c0_g1~~TRINITY_DN11425_c0_g1_i1.p1  ORF type:complete len:200 (+),score=69.71 TRINITY_DN11425_c0_g1_i1:81-680(+)